MRTSALLFVIYCVLALLVESAWSEKGKACVSKLLSDSICKAYKKNTFGKIKKMETNKNKAKPCIKWNQCTNCPQFSLPDDPDCINGPEFVGPIKKPKYWVRIVPKGVSKKDETFRGQVSGFIYDENYIVSRARPLHFLEPAGITVIAGDYSVKTAEPTEQRRNVTHIITHESYDYNNQGAANELALLKLQTPLIFNEDVGKAVIGNTPEFGQHVRMGFWGTTIELFLSDDFSSIGRTVIRDQVKCRSNYLDADHINITDDFVCVDLAEDDDCGLACTSDSAGVLLSFDGKFVLGVIHLLNDCVPDKFPFVYVKLSAHKEWLVSKTLKNNRCKRKQTSEQ